ncbi:MAG TPA: hypothetical protein EYN28_04955 [Flavobacteriales bacterium]|jgi:LytS/YehU family sensor histidine kinase|nr:hypothetical protein [Flavobacteriales bacterium]HIN41150.1 hypothetical protein [Flavobacteriales bacterium]HIO16258.1 hypothetical protein [Flavobacteriales bacterium]HIO59506.1 hypothetical protein [Flavobacteriales bacterium]
MTVFFLVWPAIILTLGFLIGFKLGPFFEGNLKVSEAFMLTERYRGINTSLIQLRRRSEVVDEIVAARKKNLQLQMNPHFIFNALTGIHMLLLRGETKPALESLRQFKGLLIRSWGSATDRPETLRASDVGKEISFLKDYVNLERLRLSGEVLFSVESRVEDGLKLPAFLIQPLVENAIWHGVDYSLEGGKSVPDIRLTFFMEEERNGLVVTVEDNGRGLDDSPNMDEAVNVSAAKRQSHGLRILRERLSLISPEAEFLLENRKDSQGCIASIFIPKGL